MSAYKQFLASDIVVTPFEVNKSFTFEGNTSIINPVVGIDRLLGKNITGSIFNPLNDPTTGQLGTQYQRLIYSSIKELYYSNYLSSSYGDNVLRPTLIPGRDAIGDRLVGDVNSPLYDNYLQSTLSYPKFFPTASDSLIGIISIPVRLFGDFISPTTFSLIAESGSINDDGEGNILSGSDIIGNIFYPHGIITITSASDDVINNFITSSNVTCSFTSSYTINETQYKCTIRENEYNLTLNPSLISSSKDGGVYSFATESYFNPFITTIGLYDEMQNLLAIGKLAQPLPSSPTTDTTILINIDR